MDRWLAIGFFLLGAGVGALLTRIAHCGLRDQAMHAGHRAGPFSCVPSADKPSIQQARDEGVDGRCA